MSEISFNNKKQSIQLNNFTMVQQSGIITGQPQDVPDQYMAVIGECIMQVIYNLAVQSKSDINYDMNINGTRYLIQGTDVIITPPGGETFRRRIKNDRSLAVNHSKD